jgi:hypothetical protein
MTGVTSFPVTVEIPSQFTGATQVLVQIIDSCGYINYQVTPLVTPTPTPTLTPTPTVVYTDCDCYTFYNTTTSELSCEITDCFGNFIWSFIQPGVLLYFCGKNPTGDTGVDIIHGSPCIDYSCSASIPIPTPTMTPTLSSTSTPTPTPSQTQTLTPTPTPTPTNIPELLQEDGYFLLQEDGGRIIIT